MQLAGRTNGSLDDNTNRQNWHAALRTHFHSQLNDPVLLNRLRSVDNAVAEAGRGRSRLIGPAGGNALEANEQMRAQAFHDQVITPISVGQNNTYNSTNGQSSGAQASTNYRREMTAALNNLCEAGEPLDYFPVLNMLRNSNTTWDFGSIDQARDAAKNDQELQANLMLFESSPSTKPKPLYNTAPSWTPETDILGIKDASGTTIQPGMLDIIRNMPPANTASVKQNEIRLSAILNTREVLLDESKGEPLSPELEAALAELNKMEAETAQALRGMGYGSEAGTIPGEFTDDEQENDTAAKGFQDAMRTLYTQKNPAISLDGKTQLLPDKSDNLPAVLSNTGTSFKSTVGADGTNRAELAKLDVGGDITTASGINSAMKAIFFIAAS
ncbi:hypothetical protein NO1_2265, partial [Candidatus Termititenax aidoneus]